MAAEAASGDADVAPPYTFMGWDQRSLAYLPFGYGLEFPAYASIKGHFDREVKKRGCKRLHWDASYKEAKHLSQHHGHKIFIALITGTKELGEIRVQFHVVTDGQGQFKRPIAELLKTLTAYGHTHPYLFSKPSVNDIFQARNPVASGQAGRARPPRVRHFGGARNRRA